MIVLFYTFFTATALLLAGWIGLEFIAAIAGARFGLLSVLGGLIERHFRLWWEMLKCLWQPAGVAFHLPLAPADAPGLFAIVERLAHRLAIRPPQEICLEMSTDAWVQLRGVGGRLGHTRVGLGYDLLAGLGPREIEAIMAHELSHAKLINRVLHQWLNGGLRRAARLSDALAAAADAGREQKKRSYLAEGIAAIGDRLTRVCARLIATYSRQHEFAADRGAADLCGSVAMASALRRLGPLATKADRLGWAQRMAAAHSPTGLGQWLAAELRAGPDETADDEDVATPRDRYSTHPSIPDRIAALPSDAAPRPPSGCSLSLLADPDRVARQLAQAIEVKLREVERRDDANLRRHFHKLRRPYRNNSTRLLAVLIALLAGVGGSFLWFGENSPLGLLVYVAGGALTYFCWRLKPAHERIVLPVPAFSRLIAAMARVRPTSAETKQRESSLEAELRASLVALRGKSRRVRHLTAAAFTALASGDYLRAHVSARLATDLQRADPAANLALAVAAADFGLNNQVSDTINRVLQKTAWTSEASLWGSGWALAMSGNHFTAEAVLQQLVQRASSVPTYRALLAWCQAQRGKNQSALRTLEPLVAAEPDVVAYAELQLNTLLALGRLDDASARLSRLPTAIVGTPRFVRLRLRLQFLRRDQEAALALVPLLTAHPTVCGPDLIQAAHEFANARDSRSAQQLAHGALQQGHYPEAQLLLAQLALADKRPDEARHRAWLALDSDRPRPVDAADLGTVFHAALNVWMQTRPRVNARAWWARVLGHAPSDPLHQHNVLIYALDEAGARAEMRELLRALHPDRADSAWPTFDLTPAAPDQQPEAPVFPGVQLARN